MVKSRDVTFFDIDNFFQIIFKLVHTFPYILNANLIILNCHMHMHLEFVHFQAWNERESTENIE